MELLIVKVHIDVNTKFRAMLSIINIHIDSIETDYLLTYT